MHDRYFILENFKISKKLKQSLLSIDKRRFRYYGMKRKRLFMCNVDLSLVPELQEVLNKFQDPNIISNFELMYTQSGTIVMPHIDSNRNAAINIPIDGDFKNSYIGFYNKGTRFVPNIVNSSEGEIVVGGGGYPGAVLIEKVSYTSPICLNNQSIHNVANFSKKDRVILGVRFNTSLNYLDILKLHQSNRLTTS